MVYISSNKWACRASVIECNKQYHQPRYLTWLRCPRSKLQRPTPGTRVYRGNATCYHPCWILSLRLSSYKLHLTSLLHPKSKISGFNAGYTTIKQSWFFFFWLGTSKCELRQKLQQVILLSFLRKDPYPAIPLSTYKIYELCHGLNCY